MNSWTNWFQTQARCPTPFFKTWQGCTMRCPYDKKFQLRSEQSGLNCVYWPDEQFKVSVVPIAPTVFEGWTLEDLQKSVPQVAGDFTSEKDRFEKELAVVYGNIDKQKKINDAFTDLQKAENVRDESPSAYQAARTAYYTLIKGEGWVNEERKRIANAEVAPEVKKYRDDLTSINARRAEQQKTIDVVRGIRDRVLSLKDDFRYSVNTFSDQLEKVKIQINMENRTREKERDNTWAWVDMILNVLLVVVLLYAIYTFARKFMTPRRPPAIPTTTIRVPTYTGRPI